MAARSLALSSAMFDVVIVAFHPRLTELAPTLDALVAARNSGLDLALQLWHNDAGVDLTPGLAQALQRARERGLTVDVRGGAGNLGFGRAINAALPFATRPHVLLLNQDAIPEPGALQRLWDVARADDARVAAWELRQIPYEHPKDYDPVTLDTVWCSAAALLLRTDALRAVSGFEPRFFMYCEDVDLSWRLRCAGWRLRYLPRCAVVHHTYSRPGEIKPLAALGGCYANLCLRTRFAGRRQVAQGVRMLLRELRGPQAFAGRRAGLLKALWRFALNYPYFRRTRQAGLDFEPFFPGWDYEQRRDAPFHAFRSQAECSGRPLPPVTALVRSNGDPEALAECRQTLEGQTHAPWHIALVDDDRPLDEQAGPGTEWLTVVDASERLYADHVEVLLQAALDGGHTGAVGRVWQVQADLQEAHHAHRLHTPRTTLDVGAALRPGRLWRRGHAADVEHWVEVPRTTVVRYSRGGPAPGAPATAPAST